MFLLVTIGIVLLVIILIHRSYKQYASGLREPPSYLLWFVTRIINFQGRSTESYCLGTDDFKAAGQSGYLTDKDVPTRNSSRPKMLRGVPHRQLTQQAPDDVMYEMHKYMESISIPRYGGEASNDQLLLRGQSILEYTGADALFLPNADQNSFDKGEVAHLHSNDGSFHMTVHPADAKLLIDQQWAERFPLAGVNLFNKITLPPTFILVYAPRNESELLVWRTVLNAAIQFNREKRKRH